MQDAGTVLAVLRERGRKGLPCDELYRQMFSKSLYLLAYGNIYPNQGAMTPGRLPKEFWIPTQRPVARVPPKISGIA